VKGTTPKFGFNLGVMYDYEFVQNLFLQTGLEFYTKGLNQEVKETRYEYGHEISAVAYYLQLPFHYAYKFEVTEEAKVVLFAGPYFAYGIGGKAELTINDEKESLDYFDDEANRFDIGIGGGIGVEFNTFNIRAGYDQGLSNVYKSDDVKTRNQNFYLTIGCRF